MKKKVLETILIAFDESNEYDKMACHFLMYLLENGKYMLYESDPSIGVTESTISVKKARKFYEQFDSKKFSWEESENMRKEKKKKWKWITSLNY